jgi:hypothetical protein
MPVENQEETNVGMFDFDTMMDFSEETDKTAAPDPLKGITEEEEEQEQEEAQEEEGKTTTKEKEAPAEPKKQTTTTESTVYSNLAKKYIERGAWQDAKMEINGEEVVLSELEDLDEETFLEIQKSQDQARQEDLKDKYIDKEELDEISLKIVEISKNKGDISKALDIKKRFIDPLEQFDLDDEAHQEALVRQKYHIESNGKLSREDIDVIIERKKKDLLLDKEASQYAESLKVGYKAYLDKENQKLAEEKVQEAENVKTLKKSVRDSLAKYGLNDASIKPLVNFIGTKDNDPLIQMVNDIKKDPEQLAELIFFLNKKEDYIRAIGNKTTTGVETKLLKKLEFIRDNKKEEKSGQVKTKEKEEEFDLRFE